MATLREVAKRARVSLSTASRVINGYMNVQEDTRRRVLEAAHDLNYSYIYREHSVKNFTVKILVSKERGTDSLLHPSIHAVTMGIIQQCNDLKIRNSMISVEIDNPDSVAQILLEPGVCILLGTNKTEEDILVPILQEHAVPFLVINRWLEKLHVSYVNIDDFAAFRDLVVEMHRKGHERFGFVNGNKEMRNSMIRLEGFREGCRVCGIPVHEEWIFHGQYDRKSGKEAGQIIAGMADRPSIVICSYDILALGFMQELQFAGIRVPEDISVVGFGDVDFAAHLQPSLTTIRMPAYEMGCEAVKALIMLRDNPLIRHIKLAFECQLIERESTCAYGEQK